jgi:phage/plasmid-like protein (TIGR03299 family)
MSAEVETMMFSGKTPWHGLGTYVGDQNVTSDMAIKAAGLDWEVELKEIGALMGTAYPSAIPGYKACVRKTDGKVLGVNGNRFRPHQPRESFDFLDSLVKEGAMRYHTAGSLYGGSKIWILAKLPGEISILNGKDVTKKYLLLADFFDGTGTLKAFFTGVRVVCANTHRIALREFNATEGMSIRHTQSLQSKVEDAKKVFGLAVEYFEGFQKKIEQLAATPFKTDQMVSVAKGLLPAKNENEVSTRTQNNRNALVQLFETGQGIKDSGIQGTAYAAYNAVTEYCDHTRGTRETENSAAENRLNSIWFGQANTMKLKGQELIEQAVLNGTNELRVTVPGATA